MVICKQCVYWDRDNLKLFNIDDGDTRRGCLSDKYLDVSDRYETHPKNNDGVSVSDMEGFAVEILMGENFGCIHGVAMRVSHVD